MNPLAALRKLADEMHECDRTSGPCYAKDWASTLDSALRLLGEGEAIAWAVFDGPVLDFVHASKRAAEGWLEYKATRQLVPLYASPVPPAVVVPEGMALVPIEPTEAMCWAGWRAPGKSFGIDQDPVHAPAAVYRAMLNARREPTNG